MAAKKRKKKRGKGAGNLAFLRWLALPVGLGLAALAAYFVLNDAFDTSSSQERPQDRRAPVATSPERRNERPPVEVAPTPAPVVVEPGSHDRDHISEDSRRKLLDILESDGEPKEGDG
jgi:hypothetical protein